MRCSLNLMRRVITVLKMECQEARFILQPWRVESLIMREADEDTCICEKVTGRDTRIDDIAADIGKMLLQAQQLREKLSLNVVKEKQRRRQPDVRTIYTSANASNQTERSVRKSIKSGIVIKDVKIVKEEETRSYKTTVATHSGTVRKTDSKNTVDLCSDIKEKSCCKNIRFVGRTLCNSNTQIEKPSTSSAGSSSKSTSSKELKKSKNFIIANKLSVKNLSRERNRKSIGEQRYASPGSSTRVKACAASTTELNNLIEKISLNSTKSMSMPYLSTIRDDCPFHGMGAPRLIEKLRVDSLDAMEAFDRYGVREDVLNVLKLYHIYMKSKTATQPVAGPTPTKTVNAFLGEFDKMNDTAQHRCTSKSHFVIMIGEFMSVLKDVARENVSPLDIAHACRRIEELDDIHRMNDSREKFYVEQLLNRETVDELASCNPFLSRGWMSNGLWNGTCVKDVEDLFRSSCIRYSNSNQLHSLFAIIQQLQQVKYFEIHIDYILNCLIPKVKRFANTSDADYARIYKMIFILSDGLNPRIPVLARTDM